MDNVEYETPMLTAMNDAEFILSNAVEILAKHEAGEEGYSLEELIFEHYNATVYYFPRGGGYVKALGGMFRHLLTIRYENDVVTLVIDKMIVGAYAEDAPYKLEYRMLAPKFIKAISDITKGKVESKIKWRSIEEWKN